MTAYAPVHPSQRRVACELCRRHKSKCQRIHRHDSKCSRCMILGKECITGQQKKVGRPKHVASPARGAPRETGSISRPAANAAVRRKAPDRHSQEDCFFRPEQAEDLGDVQYNLDPPPVAMAAAEGYSVRPIWSNPGMETMQRTQLIPNIAFDDDEFPMAGIDSSSNWRASDNDPPNPAGYRIYGASPTLEMAGHESSQGDIASTDAMTKLSQINLDLHIRIAAAEKCRTMVDLNTLLYPQGPLFIGDYTLAEFILKTSEDFSQILTRLRIAHIAPPLTMGDSPSFSAKPLPAPLALTITSIFAQLISLHELVLDHLITRIERLSTDPLTPIRTVKFKGLLQPDKPCAQGTVFSNAIVALLEEMEGALGINDTGEPGGMCLLSARQADVLRSELEGRVGITSPAGGEAMRLADVKQLFRKVATVLCEFSLRE
ncbi:hypothetical protein ASPCAL14024 [Aspergillus calidoustus]|uniref:Zn(2)-C6 fungal-type domain-containing protein n=1 Tax=Aspergillus calidoustus TaxID=454130 RepID=A0A0U4ZN86_ASPCI|nr:hypothetical protein ASPCAL14024 [Aspergillus calidoustus]